MVLGAVLVAGMVQVLVEVAPVAEARAVVAPVVVSQVADYHVAEVVVVVAPE